MAMNKFTDEQLAQAYDDGKQEYLDQFEIKSKYEPRNGHLAGLRNVFNLSLNKEPERKVIDSFTGDNYFLSNFYHCPFMYDKVMWDTSEHAFQAMKTLDKKDRETIRREKSPGKVKRLGKLLSLRKDWEQIKLSIMKDILIAKFSIPELKEMLLKTGDAELIEGNTWGDTYWGVCQQVGENNLGKLLMEIRGTFRS